MFLNCASFAFQHTFLWSGPVSPSITLRDGEQRRSTGPIVADVVTVLSSFVLSFALDFVRRDLGLAVATVAATLGLVLFAASHGSAMLSTGQVFYGVGSAGVKVITNVLVVETVRDKYNLPGAFAVMALPRAVALISVSTVRYGSHESQLRHALEAFAVLAGVTGLLLVCVLHHYSAHLTLPTPFRVVMLEFRARWLDQPGRLVGRILLGVALLGMFIFLWLVQMDILPSVAAIPPLVTFLIIVAPFSEWAQETARQVWFQLRFILLPDLDRKRVRLRHAWHHRRRFKLRSLTSIIGPLRRLLGFCRKLSRKVTQKVFSALSSPRRWCLTVLSNSPSWASELSFRSLFLSHPLMSKPQFAVCASCLIWRSTCCP